MSKIWEEVLSGPNDWAAQSVAAVVGEARSSMGEAGAAVC